MDPLYLILLYSKYSQSCVRILNLLKSTPSIEFIKMICVDNTKIRSRLLASNIRVKRVPSILFVYPNKSIEVFEEEGVYEYLVKLISLNTEKPEENPQEPAMQYEVIPQQFQKTTPQEVNQSALQMNKTLLEDIEPTSSYDDAEREQEQNLPVRDTSIINKMAALQNERKEFDAMISRQHPK